MLVANFQLMTSQRDLQNYSNNESDSVTQGTYNITEAVESGFAKLTPALYFAKLPEAVRYLASAPKAMLGVPMVAEKSTEGDWLKRTAVVKVACSLRY